MKLVKLPGTNAYVNPAYVVSVKANGVENETPYVTVLFSKPVVSGMEKSDSKKSAIPAFTENNCGINVFNTKIEDVVKLLTGSVHDLSDSELDGLLDDTSYAMEEGEWE